MTPKRTAFRRSSTRSFGILVASILLAAGVLLEAHPGVEKSLWGRWTYGLMMSGAVWLIWRCTVAPAVVVGKDHVDVVQPFTAIRIPWQCLADLTGDDGFSLVLIDGRVIRPWAFSGSLVGNMAGNPSSRKLRHSMEDARLDADDPEGVVEMPRRKLAFGVWLFLVLSFSYGVIAAALAASGH